MNILEQIVAHKYEEVAKRKISHPVKLLEQSDHFEAPVISLKDHLLNPGKTGVISEFKRKSPSKGVLNTSAAIEQVSQGYIRSGASALSILTDHDFFGGANEDIIAVQKFTDVPILRKDFIIDEYQVIEAKSIGADAVLLIAAILSKERLRALALFAASLGLEVLLEIHEKEELNKLNTHIDIIGVNNRNLKTFVTDVRQSSNLRPFIPDGFVKISESGIDDPLVAAQLKQEGFDGFLIGEQFMKHNNPEAACAEFIRQLQKLVYAT